MVFLISLALALLLVFALGRPLRKHPVPFYICAVIIAVIVVVCTFADVRFPAWFNTYVWPVFARGALAGALFVLVMAAGAFPAGSRGVKIFLPVRGQLSILACILTLGHNIAYGRTYFVMLFTRPARMPVTTLIAAVCSILMICIMLPLFVTSFPAVRKKMGAGTWKKLQRLSYVFYALLICHILLLTIPYAIRNRAGYKLTVFVYSAIFISYFICRTLKAVAVKNKTQKALPKKQLAGVICGVVAAGLILGGVSLRASAVAAETEAAAAAAVTEPAEAPETPAPATETPAPAEAREAVAAPDPTETPEPPETQVPAETEPSAPEETPARTEAPQPPATSEPTPGPTPEPAPETARAYKDGTYIGSGLGNNGTPYDITVSVTIENDRIVSIVITGFLDDPEYFSPGIEGASMINAMLGVQSPNVDTVSGATYSSEGLIDAVRAALAQARN